MSVVGLGAWFDFKTEDESGVWFDVHEFADLADGRRLTLHSEQGFGGAARTVGSHPVGSHPVGSHPGGSHPGGNAAAPDPWRYLTVEALERGVRTTALPDDDDSRTSTPGSGSPGYCSPTASRPHRRNSSSFRTKSSSATSCWRN